MLEKITTREINDFVSFVPNLLAYILANYLIKEKFDRCFCKHKTVQVFFDSQCT